MTSYFPDRRVLTLRNTTWARGGMTSRSQSLVNRSADVRCLQACHTHTHIHTADKFFTFDLCCASICTYFSTLPFCFLNVNVMQRSVACFVLRPRSKCDSELQLWGQCLRHCLHQYLHRLVNSKLVGAGDGTPKQPHFQESAAAAAASTVKTRSIMFSRISSDVIFTAPRCKSLSFLSRLETDADTDTWFSLFFCFLVDFQ